MASSRIQDGAVEDVVDCLLFAMSAGVPLERLACVAVDVIGGDYLKLTEPAEVKPAVPITNPYKNDCIRPDASGQPCGYCAYCDESAG